MAEAALLATLSLLVVILSAHVLTEACVNFARRLRTPEAVIGFTLLAVGTSLPEMAVGIAAAVQGQPTLVFGTVYGSNLANVCLGIGLGILLTGTAGDRTTTLPALMGLAAFLLLAALMLDDTLGRWDGGLLLLLTAAAAVALMRGMHRKGAAPPEEPAGGAEASIPYNLLLAAAGLAGLPLACDALVEYSTQLAWGLGVSERVIGFFLVAAGTSGPEIAVSIQCAVRGRAKLLFGNIAGSNLFNIGAGLGLASLAAPLVTPAAETLTQWRDWTAMLVGGIALLVATRAVRAAPVRLLGAGLVAAYLGYAYLVAAA